MHLEVWLKVTLMVLQEDGEFREFSFPGVDIAKPIIDLHDIAWRFKPDPNENRAVLYYKPDVFDVILLENQ